MRLKYVGMICMLLAPLAFGADEFVYSSEETFQLGEKLEFDIEYEFVSAGRATLEVTKGGLINGKPTLRFSSKAESVGMIDSVFRVRDFNESMVEADSLATLSFHQNLREGNFKVIRNTRVDYSSGTWTYEKKYKGKTQVKAGPITERASDILSSFFFTRVLPLQPGGTYFIKVFSDDTIYPLKIVVGSKLETIKVPAGTFECLRVEPFIMGDGLFKSKDGKLILYLTNDKRKMPVLMRSKVFIGSFDAELVRFETGRARP